MKPRGYLMIEHRLIEKVLSLISKAVDQMDEKGTVDQYFVQSVVDFIRTYADRTHHGKEEDILFQQLKTRTLNPCDKAMMDELIEEHKNARLVVSELIQSEAGFMDGDRAQIRVIKEKLTFLMNLYPNHIAKEDHSFFPNTERYFTADELAKMLDDFHAFDRNMIHEKYTMLYESLSANLSKMG